MNDATSEPSRNRAGRWPIQSPLATFLFITFSFSAIFYALILASGKLGGGGGKYVTGLMWCPAFGALLTCRIHHFALASLGWRWPGSDMFWASYLLPAGYALVGYTLIWATQLGSFPAPSYVKISVEAIGIDTFPAWLSVALFVLLNAAFGFIRGCASALGEEIGWRGFLAPYLAGSYGFAAASFITGGIWAAWHFPILIFGDYNAGTPSWYALTCFTVMVLASSVIYTWFRLMSGSLWTATFLHASHNAMIQSIFTPITGDTGNTRYVVDEFGFVLPIIISLLAIGFWKRRKVAMDVWQRSCESRSAKINGGERYVDMTR